MLLNRGQRLALRKRVAVLEKRMDFRDRQGVNETNRRIDHLIELVTEHDEALEMMRKAIDVMRDNRDNSEPK